jgi:hypothetical protein
MSGQIELAKRWTKASEARLLSALKTTPDDKLTWAPSSTCRTALQVAAHAGVVTMMMSRMIAGESMPGGMPTIPQITAMAKAEEDKITSREQAAGLIESSTAMVMKGLDSMSPETLASAIPTPFGESPMASFVLLPSGHMDSHAAQIDYIQTIYGDTDMHMG